MSLFSTAQNTDHNRFVLVENATFASVDTSSHPSSSFRQLDQTEVNLLFSYYEQEGDHSVVTGGVGSQELHDLEFGIIVNIPIDSLRTLNLNGGLTSYTSASNDRINFKVSSASEHEYRGRLDATYTWQQPQKRTYFGLMAGFSGEVDYISSSIGAKWGITSRDGNRSLDVLGKFYFDIWGWVIYPQELRYKEWVDTNIRETYNLSLTYSQVINTRLQASFFVDGIYQSGLLSTPFHRVYFAESDEVRVEKLPDNRFKLPIGLRLNYYLNDLFVLRTYYRYYRDNFGIEGHTTSIEVPIQVNPFLSISPFYRYHTQTGANYFAPFKTHELDAAYYSSDYDLSALNSHKVGFGLRYAPLYGIGRFKTPFARGKKVTLFEGMDFRAAYYSRSDGLSAFLVSLGLDFLM
ncbi:MAG: DUF3570 domain-containing protein [Chitinophagales bacterium]